MNHLIFSRRRRSNYKIALYFRYQLIVSLIGGCVFFYLGVEQLLGAQGSLVPSSTCTYPLTSATVMGTTVSFKDATTGLPNAEAFMEYAEQSRSAWTCSSDYAGTYVEAICSTSDIYVLAGMMITIGLLFIIVGFFCMFLQMGYSFFSNLPLESINAENSDYRITCLGAIAKQGPKVLRLANVAAFLLLVSMLIITQGADYCKGDTTNTHNCVSLYDDCAYNQIKNCQFYMSSSCTGLDPAIPTPQGSASNCLDAAVFTKFSGRFDARLLHPSSPLVACWMLHYDCQSADTNIFHVVKSSNTGYFFGSSSTSYAPYYGSTTDTSNLLGAYIYCTDKLKSASYMKSSTVSAFDSAGCTALLAKATWAKTTCTLTDSYTIDHMSTTYNTYVSNSETNAFALYRNDLTAQGSASQQYCSTLASGKTEAAYYFEETECDISGSYVSRSAFLATYLMLSLSTLTIAIGILLRRNLEVETWSYDPPAYNENSFWKFVRLTGPG